MSSITNTLNLQINNDSIGGPVSSSSGSILPQNGNNNGLATTIGHHAPHFHGKSKFSQDLGKLQQTDPSFVTTLQNNVQTAVKQAQSQGQTGSALASVAQNAVMTTFASASASDQSAINAAFGSAIYGTNGTFNGSALQSVFAQSGGSTSTGINASSNGGMQYDHIVLGASQNQPLTDGDGDHDASPSIGGVNISA